MDNRQNPYGMDPYYKGAQINEYSNNKVPFYMAYPPVSNYQDELEYERDMDKFKRIYPEQARLIQKYVDEECDKMEYEGSQMFDEYPDQVTLRGIAKRICDKMEMQSVDTQQYRPFPPGPPHPSRPPYPPRPPHPQRPQPLRDFVEIILFNEIFRRRCRHNRCRRWW